MPASKTIHLICNAHLDPVWLWNWEEGAGEALSTFRIAADFCDKNADFIFCHNEVILYQWVEEYDPALFKRIQALVKAGRWHIMGGWYLQPDCTMPSGEALVRQMMVGRNYFKEKFCKTPTTAINFDPFGHSRGLVQILAKAGFDAYIITRPGSMALPGSAFRWRGYDGSEILVTRAPKGYNTLRGHAAEKASAIIEEGEKNDAPELVLWGIGNHGGGPSKIDLDDLNRLKTQRQDVSIRHSTPEAYFRDLAPKAESLGTVSTGLNPCMVGCYSSQVRIKQEYRALENEYFLTEKLSSMAALQESLPYPKAELASAQQDLLTAQFHDILPGSAIKSVEESSLRLMAHGREILARVRAKALFALTANQPLTPKNTIPVFVTNPHPYPVTTVIDCEFNLADQNWEPTFTDIAVSQGRKRIPAQIEKEASNLTLDWRKRVVFTATLKPMQMTRFLCTPVVKVSAPKPSLKPSHSGYRIKTDNLDVIINTRTGLLDRYRIGTQDYLKKSACTPVILQDSCDPWESRQNEIGPTICGQFKLMSATQATACIGGTAKRLKAVRVIEEGPVRTVIEALFQYGRSTLIMQYGIPQTGSELELKLKVHWHEQDKALKLCLPAAFKPSQCMGDSVYGAEALTKGGQENVSQRWQQLQGRAASLSCINDGIYGSDFRGGMLRLTLLRSPAYASLPLPNQPLIRNDRHTDRIDQGERHFRFWLNGGEAVKRANALPREAQARNESPLTLSFFPSGEKPSSMEKPLIQLSDKAVLLTAFKQAEQDRDFILRFFEPTGKARKTILSMPALGINLSLTFSPFEVKTLRVNLCRKTITPDSLLA